MRDFANMRLAAFVCACAIYARVRAISYALSMFLHLAHTILDYIVPNDTTSCDAHFLSLAIEASLS